MPAQAAPRSVCEAFKAGKADGLKGKRAGCLSETSLWILMKRASMQYMIWGVPCAIYDMGRAVRNI